MSERVPLSNALIKFWWVAIALGGPLVLEQLWEQTFLTWRRGPQMVGFGLMHVYPELAIAGLLGYFMLFVWLLVAAIFLFRHKALPIHRHIPFLVLPIVAIASTFVPYSFWASLGGVHI